jgi:predicted molibdopterin-dependent oxidoreductase YjgC
MNDRITLLLDGAGIEARPGQSVGAALTDAGIRSWRTTRQQGRPRGLFCGIGICYDCLLTVDGVPNQRACLVPARDGMRLESHRPAADGVARTATDRKADGHG